MQLGVFTHLVMVPVGEPWWNLHPQRAFVHREVQVVAVVLHGDLVPVLVVQQAAQRQDVPAVR